MGMYSSAVQFLRVIGRSGATRYYLDGKRVTPFRYEMAWGYRMTQTMPSCLQTTIRAGVTRHYAIC